MNFKTGSFLLIIQYVIIVIDYCVFKLGQKGTLINIID